MAVADESMGGPLWVKNANGVRLELETDVTGIILNLGADGLVIVPDTPDSGASDDASP